MLEKDLSTRDERKWVWILILLAFCFVIYFLNLGRWDLWNPDEPRYAQITREMVQGGDWMTMHYNGSVYRDKPPVFFWLIAFSSYLWGGFSSFSVRFPSAFFGTLTVLLTFVIGRSLYHSRTGFISGLILATSGEFAYLTTRANIDATLTFFTTASLLCFLGWYQNRKSEGGGNKRANALFIYGFYLGMALGTLTKGPIGLLPLAVSLIYLLIQKDWDGIKKMRLLYGMLLFLIILFSWYGPMVMKGGKAYVDETISLHMVNYYLKGWQHVRPIYYYLLSFPMQFLPWIFFLPAALMYGFSKRMIEKRRRFLFLLIWSMVIFIFFSLSKGKRSIYLLPLFPSVSLMVGKLWSDFLSASLGDFRREWISYPLYGLMGLLFLLGGVLPWVAYLKFPVYFSYSIPVAFCLVGSSFAMSVLYRFRKYEVIFLLIIGMTAGGFFYALRVVFPLANPYRSARFLCQELTSRIQPGDQLAIYGMEPAPYNYYTGIVPILELDGEASLFNFLKSSKRVFCILRSKDFTKVENRQEWPRVQLIAERGIEGKEVIVISNR
jgi:4-amino-4-deoxy-L-arabinose transferase-like glycosyltransferase